MKLRRVGIANVRSFLDRQELQLPGDISIIIGPNGGGKTNLLDTAVVALRLFLLKSWMPRLSPIPDWPDRFEWVNNDAMTPALLEKHSAGGALPQVIELDLEVTQPDIDNMTRTRAEASELHERSKSRYTSFPGQSAASWSLDGLSAGARLVFRIVNGSLQSDGSPSTQAFQSYLETYEVHSRVREEYERLPLSMPMISLPVNRSIASDVSASVSLATFNEYDLKRTVDAASSRAAGSITSLAIGRLATRYRELLEYDDGQAQVKFKDDAAVRAFSDTLRTLGYEWDLKCTNPLKNQYDIQLRKQGSSFRVGAASSGERELLTYLFAIYALNVRHALIVVDEPELHLHPRWQRTLLGLFEHLSRDTGNQFLLATHSPMFVSPSSIQYVSRVYADNQESRVVRLGDADLPERKHLFGIVNSQNNERLFFADLVVLVEGISDRILFEALCRHFQVGEGTGRVYEIVSVGGKTLFGQYEKLLMACRVPYVIIADLDYARDVGNEAIKAVFAPSVEAVKHKALDDPSSVDGKSLVARMEEAIESGSTDQLKILWQYVKSRHTKLRTDLSDDDRKSLAAFIADQRSDNRFILSRGALEAYLPDGFRDKDLEKIIRLVAEPGLWNRLPADGREELREIVNGITTNL